MSSSYVSLGDAISAFLKKHGLDEKVRIREALQDFEGMYGAPVAKNTEKAWVENGTLYVKVSHPAWRQELGLARMRMKEIFNRRVGKEVIQEVRIL